MDGPDAEVHGAEVDAGAPEDLDHIRLQHDPPAPAIEIVRGAFVEIDVPADPAQQVAGEKAAERSADHQRTGAGLTGCGCVAS